MKKVNFGNPDWKKSLIQCYSFRFTETPCFTQLDDHITTTANQEHREGFDNISLLSPNSYTADVKASLRCSFEGCGCAEIILVEKTKLCEDGVIRYGACFEIVLYKNGVNIWRHYMDETTHRCYWHKRLALEISVSENEIHELKVEVIENYIIFEINGVRSRLRTDDLPKSFHIGVTACEGISRLYDFQIVSNKELCQ